LNARVLILPGLYNSGPGHWQSIWEKENPAFTRVDQRDWDTPDIAEWVERLHEQISASTMPAVLVAHSSACALVAHWAAAHRGPVHGALLVGPSDPEAESYPKGTTGFSPMPLAPLPFRTIVVASTNDEYVTIERARFFAGRWGARFEIVGNSGHINSDSGLGRWPAGFALLKELIDGIDQERTVGQVSFSPIGYVSSPATKKVDNGWGGITARVILHPDFVPGLKGLEQFSHALVITHLHMSSFDRARHIIRRPRGLATMPETGIFSQRAKDRPNPIGITAVKILAVGEGFVDVRGLDAVDGTPVLDIKPYVPQFDRVDSATVPEWMERLMEGYF
jgi:uncharacterized protein